MLARVPSTRATGDIDLYGNGFTLDQALTDLLRLAAIDLRDHFTFGYSGVKTISGGDSQPCTTGYRVTFDVFIGVKLMGPLGVDLVVGPGATTEASTVEPANRLHMPRLTTNEYRIFPVVGQIADKVCATVTSYRGRAAHQAVRRISSIWLSSPSPRL